MTIHDAEHARTVRCPACAADPAQDCRDQHGQPMVTLHNARYDRSVAMRSAPVMHEVEVREIIADAIDRVLTMPPLVLCALSRVELLRSVAAEIREPWSRVTHRRVG